MIAAQPLREWAGGRRGVNRSGVGGVEGVKQVVDGQPLRAGSMSMREGTRCEQIILCSQHRKRTRTDESPPHPAPVCAVLYISLTPGSSVRRSERIRMVWQGGVTGNGSVRYEVNKFGGVEGPLLFAGGGQWG
jgi:hypothetical protein